MRQFHDSFFLGVVTRLANGLFVRSLCLGVLFGVAVGQPNGLLAASPDITSFTPTSGSVGTEVTISGTSLDTVTEVTFNGTSAGAPTVDSPTSIRVHVPAGATTGKISATNPDGTATSADDFCVPPDCVLDGPVTVCASALSTYSHTGSAGDSYSWSVTDSGVAVGPTDGPTFIVRAGVCGQTYTVHLTITKNGCSSTCQLIVQVANSPAPLLICPTDQYLVSGTLAGTVQGNFTTPADVPDSCTGDPLAVTCIPSSGSFFPVGKTEVCCYTDKDSCGNIGQCCFNVYVFFENSYTENLIPPPLSRGVKRPGTTVLYRVPTLFPPDKDTPLIEVEIIQLSLSPFAPSLDPNSLVPGDPPVPVNSFFDVFFDIEYRTAGGAPVHVRAPVQNPQKTVRRLPDQGGKQIIETELLMLNLTGLPGGVMIRESPTQASTGRTTLATNPDGTYRIGSFFDVFTEISLDGGAHWTEATAPLTMVTVPGPPEIELASNELPPAGQFVSPDGFITYYRFPPNPPTLPSGFVVCITNICHGGFSPSEPPPLPGNEKTLNFQSHANLRASIDGGNSFFDIFVDGLTVVRVISSQDSGNTRFFETEMLQLNLTGNSPFGPLTIRESPTLPSKGKTSIRSLPGGHWAVDSFFDVFTELSVDGSPGIPADDPVPMRLLPALCAELVCPPDLMVECGDDTTPAGSGAATTSNPCGIAPVSVTWSDLEKPGLNCPVDHVVRILCRTWTATDQWGNTTNCTQIITVKDTGLPTVQCPADLTALSGNGLPVNVTFAAVANDACDSAPTVDCMPPSGSAFSVGTTTVTCTATDACGNGDVCDFKVTVIDTSVGPRCADIAVAGLPDGTEFPPGSGKYVGYNVFAKLQDAVDATPAGGTVRVAPGTYPELVIVGAPMMMLGPNAGVDPRTTCNGGAVRGPEAIIDGMGIETAIAFMSSGITLDGFTIQGGCCDGFNAGLHMGGGFDDNHVLNNIITGNTIGVFANCAGPLPTVIQRNLFDANNLPGPAGGSGIYVDGSASLRILENEFKDHTINNAVIIGATMAVSHTDLVFSGNHLHDNTAGSAVYVVGITGGTFSRNRISAYGPGFALFTGLRFGGANTSISVANNSFTDCDVGVRVADDGFLLGDNSDIHINANSFAGMTSFAVAREGGYSDPVLDASANWWDVATLAGVPGEIDTTGGPLDYTPWLITGVEPVANVCDGFQGDFSTLQVDDDSPQFGPVGRFQEAVGLVTASTVLIAPGAYSENIVIGPALAVNLHGAGSGTGAGDTIITAANAALPVIDITDIGGAGAGSRLTIKDLRVTGGAHGIRVSALTAARSFYRFDNVAAVLNAAGAGITLEGPEDLSDVEALDCILNGNNTGLRVNTGIPLFSTLLVENGEIRDNLLHGLGINPNGTDGTDPLQHYTGITVDGATFEHNGDMVTAGSGDLSFFRFNGNATVKNVSVTSDGHFPIQFRGEGTAASGTWSAAGTITLQNVDVTGSGARPGLYIVRYSDVAGFSFNDVDLCGYTPPSVPSAFASAMQIEHSGAAQLDLGSLKLPCTVVLAPAPGPVPPAGTLVPVSGFYSIGMISPEAAGGAQATCDTVICGATTQDDLEKCVFDADEDPALLALFGVPPGSIGDVMFRVLSITCPGDIVQECTGSGSAVVSWAAPSVMADCPPLIGPMCVPPSGSTFSLGMMMVTCTVTDDRGITVTCAFNVTVEDATPPLIGTITATEMQAGFGTPNVKNCVNATVPGTVMISFQVSEACGLMGTPIIGLTNGLNGELATLFSVNVDPPGTFNYIYTWAVTATTASGTWIARVTANDCCTSASTTFTLCVNQTNVTGQVQLQGFRGTGTVPLHTRTVTFVATEVPLPGVTNVLKTWVLSLSNVSGDTFDYTLLGAPAGATHLSAKTAWNLRRRLPVSSFDLDGQSVVDFSVANQLLAGDMNNDNRVQTFDYGLLNLNWLSTTPNNAADLDGTGVVQTFDYGLLSLNWSKLGDPQ